MPANTPKSKQVKYKDSKTGKIFTITKHSNGRFTKNGQPVTPNANQKPYNPGTRKESNAQRLARLKREKKNGKKI